MRLAQAADGDFGDDLFQHWRGHGGDHVGVDITGGDRVDGDAIFRAFLRQRLCEAVDARLGGGIVDLAILAGLAVDRADIDDPAPAALAHAAEGGLRHVEAAAQVDAHHFVPVIEAHLGEHAVAGDARIVDDDVDGAERFGDLRAAIEAGLMIAHVPFEGGDAGLVGEGLGLFLIAGIVGGDGIAHFLERETDRLPDASRSAGYDRHSRHISVLFQTGSVHPTRKLAAHQPLIEGDSLGRCV